MSTAQSSENQLELPVFSVHSALIQPVSLGRIGTAFYFWRILQMISRYCRSEMAKIWADRHKYATWLAVELAVCEQLAKENVIPKKDWLELKKRAGKLLSEEGIDPSRVEYHETRVKHDVIAFTTTVAEKIGPVSRYIHFGLTSSDVVDTALSLQICEAGGILQNDLKALLVTLRKLAQKYRKLPTIGRSHGIFAEPTSFGLKFLGWYSEWLRNSERLDRALENMRIGKLSGAVGVNAHWSPVFESAVLNRLSLKRELVSTQVIPRDRHAELLQCFALLGSSLERIAVELRHLQRSEVAEVREGFSKGQKGSSAMPHKRNPISSENISGCARLLRSYAQAGLENVALWHERDISHSSVERVAIPDSMLLLDYSLHRMKGILEGLFIDGRNVGLNLQRAGETVFSGHILLELVKAGATREDAYSWVQSCAMAAMEKKANFIDLIVVHPEIKSRMSEAKLRSLGSIAFQLRNVPEIYRRVLSDKKRK